MASILQIKTSELASKILKMNKVERFSKMKKFYISSYPKCRHFYTEIKQQSNKLDEQGKKRVDYYENLGTFENVLNLIDPVDEKNENEIEEIEVEFKEKKESIDELFQNFINESKEKVDDKCLNKSTSSKNLVNLEPKDKYDELLDDIFDF